MTLKKEKLIRLPLLLVVLAMTIGSLGCSKLYVRNTYMIKGNYSATDVADGNIKISDIHINKCDNKIFIDFNNNITLVLRAKKFEQGKESRCIVKYRGHIWYTDAAGKPIMVKIDDVCYDTYKNTFYVKFSTNFTVKDCEKPILSFKCEKLTAQHDLLYHFKLGRLGAVKTTAPDSGKKK